MGSAPVEESNLLDLAPTRCAEWQNGEDGLVVLVRPRPKMGAGLRSFAERLCFWLSTPRLRLDRLGSFTWLRLDGKTTVGTIAEAIRNELDESEQIGERVGRFIRSLHREGMVKY
jgi:hypothetical protein